MPTSIRPMSAFGARLLAAMEARGLGHNELGRAIGKGPGYVSALITEGRDPRLTNVIALAVALKVRMDWLATGEGPMELEDEGQPVDPWERVRRRPEYQGLPAWAQEEWHARTQNLTRSREIDTVKEGKLLQELGQVRAEIERGELTEDAVGKAPPVAPTPPPRRR